MKHLESILSFLLSLATLIIGSKSSGRKKRGCCCPVEEREGANRIPDDGLPDCSDKGKHADGSGCSGGFDGVRPSNAGREGEEQRLSGRQLYGWALILFVLLG